MSTLAILIGNLVFLIVILLILLIVAAGNGRNKFRKNEPQKVKEDIEKIKEQIYGD